MMMGEILEGKNALIVCLFSPIYNPKTQEKQKKQSKVAKKT